MLVCLTAHFAPCVLALLGLAGTATASFVTGWLMPAMIVLSILLLGHSFYILYVKRRGSRATARLLTLR